MKKSTNLYRAVLTLTVISGLCGAALTPAWADRDDWHGHAREAREWHQRHWHHGRVVYENGEPYVTYAPPVVVEPPPPAYYPPEPGLNIVVPLNFR